MVLDADSHCRLRNNDLSTYQELAHANGYRTVQDWMRAAMYHFAHFFAPDDAEGADSSSHQLPHQLPLHDQRPYAGGNTAPTVAPPSPPPQAHDPIHIPDAEAAMALNSGQNYTANQITAILDAYPEIEIRFDNPGAAATYFLRNPASLRTDLRTIGKRELEQRQRAKKEEEEAIAQEEQEQREERQAELARQYDGQPNPDAQPEALQLWEEILEQMQQILPKPTYVTWLKPTAGFSLTDLNLTIEAPSEFAAQWLNRRLYAALQTKARQSAGNPGLQLTIRARTYGAAPTEASEPET